MKSCPKAGQAVDKDTRVDCSSLSWFDGLSIDVRSAAPYIRRDPPSRTHSMVCSLRRLVLAACSLLIVDAGSLRGQAQPRDGIGFTPRVASMPFSASTPPSGTTAHPLDAGVGRDSDFAKLGARARGAFVLVEQQELKDIDGLFKEYDETGKIASRVFAAGVVYTGSRPNDLLHRPRLTRQQVEELGRTTDLAQQIKSIGVWEEWATGVRGRTP